MADVVDPNLALKQLSAVISRTGALTRSSCGRIRRARATVRLCGEPTNNGNRSEGRSAGFPFRANPRRPVPQSAAAFHIERRFNGAAALGIANVGRALTQIRSSANLFCAAPSGGVWRLPPRCRQEPTANPRTGDERRRPSRVAIPANSVSNLVRDRKSRRPPIREDFRRAFTIHQQFEANTSLRGRSRNPMQWVNTHVCTKTSAKRWSTRPPSLFMRLSRQLHHLRSH
jgi:hypothetical protein